MLIFTLPCPHNLFKEFLRTILREIFSYEKKSRKVMAVGRRAKYEGPVKRFEAWLPYDVYKEMEAEKQRRGISWPELILEMWDRYKASLR